ncbi:MAG: tyrosine-type recombinase/integrase [Pannonibacter sp.]
MSLTDTVIKQAAKREKPYQLRDKQGLYVLVRPNGSKLWRFDFSFAGKRRTMSFGSYPVVTLAKARQKQLAAKVMLEEGRDPVREMRQEAIRVRAETETFKELATDYLKKLEAEGKAESTLTKNTWLLMDLAKGIHDIPTNEVTAADILPILLRLEKMGKVVSATRLRGVIGSVFRFGIPRQRAETDPTYALRGAIRANVTKSHSAIVEEEAFGGLLRAIWGYRGWAPLAAGLKILAYCYPRPVELRKCEWTHVDLERRVWTVPEHLAKMRRQHDIPLPTQAVEVFQQLKEIGNGGPYVFFGIRSNQRFLSENAFNSALRTMGYEGEDHVSHGFRSSASTLLRKYKFDGDLIERSLAHVEQNETRRAYDRYKYWDERVEMAQAWADHCDRLRTSPPVGMQRKRVRDHEYLI